jgi:peptide deformylase
MALLKIARMGHPVLVRQADPVPDPTARDIRRLVEDMIETMEDAEGVGLAAPQVHVSRRVMIFKSPPGRADADDPLAVIPLTALVNPEIEPLTDEMVDGFEGCLSIPGLTGIVPRYARIGYRGFTPRGEKIEREATGFHARVVQHELDHLNGVLYTMRMPDLRLLSFTDELRHSLAREESEDDADEAGDAPADPA